MVSAFVGRVFSAAKMRGHYSDRSTIQIEYQPDKWVGGSAQGGSFGIGLVFVTIINFVRNLDSSLVLSFQQYAFIYNSDSKIHTNLRTSLNQTFTSSKCLIQSGPKISVNLRI